MTTRGVLLPEDRELKVFLQTDVTVLEVMRELSYEP
jgi:hypothetical protein